MTDVFIAAVIFGAIVIVIRIITDTMTRHRLIQKGIVDENIKHLFFHQGRIQPLSSVKWGLVLIGIGLALGLRQLVPEFHDETIFGLMFLFAGIAFLIYYGIARSSQGKDNRTSGM